MDINSIQLFFIFIPYYHMGMSRHTAYCTTTLINIRLHKKKKNQIYKTSSS